MKYLVELGFTQAELDLIKGNNPGFIVDKIDSKQKLITKNLGFLKDLGVDNYKDIFVNYSEFFLQDNEVFEKIFSKYDRQDLVEKLKKNMAIIVRL